MRLNATASIIAAMILGLAAGTAPHGWANGKPALAKETAGYFTLLADIFLHLIKMIIVPLVFSTLVTDIAHMGDGAALGRIGGRALAWFITASLISLTIGLISVNLFAPGDGLDLVRSAADSVFDRLVRGRLSQNARTVGATGRAAAHLQPRPAAGLQFQP